MAIMEQLQELSRPLRESVVISQGPSIEIRDPKGLSQSIETLVRQAVFATEPTKSHAQWLIRALAGLTGAYPASIHEFYLARGRGETPDDFTVPAMNLRALPFHAARAVFRSAISGDACAFIFEIARSEMGYTDQRPAEYASTILGAAIAEGYSGPVFIQGDHFQVSSGRYKKDEASEIEAIRALIDESIRAGFFNIDIDTSTLVDLSQPTISEQQTLNFTLCADFSVYTREKEPDGVTISLGGEIGEVGGQNSTEPELRAFMEGFSRAYAERLADAPGLSKISIQTGTSHGGVVLPDGSIASVSVDFKTLKELSSVAKQYGLGGAVQHGASTLPEEMFTSFAESNALEVHLATGFQNILCARLPADLLAEIYAYLDESHAGERKDGQTDEQFHYNTRKRALGPFKQVLWDLEPEALVEIEDAWETQFQLLFDRLNIGGTRKLVERYVPAIDTLPTPGDYLAGDAVEEDVRDLAD
jgi:fructose/tagatose bisphosphate aldolase